MVIIVNSREDLERQVVLMHRQEGWSIRGLARYFNISRNTVRLILRKQIEQREQGHDPVKPARRVKRNSKLDPFVTVIRNLLEKYPRITGQRVHEELRDQGYDGGISILRNRLRELRPLPKREPIIRFETAPGLQGQMDWSPYTIRFKKTGPGKVQCFSYILGFSRRQYIDFTRRRDFFTLIRRHQDAFDHFNGVPEQCLYDSEKTVVLRWEAGQPVINPAFSAFITHYGIRPVICRRGRGETKGKVERPFQYVEGNLLCGREFQDLEDLRAHARWWLAEKSDRHTHGTTGRPPLELFLEEEASALQALPLHPYDSGEVALRVCDPEGYLAFDTNRYPVPYGYIADILTMKATEHEILIYAPDLSLIVRHERLPAGAQVTLDGSAIHESKAVRYGLESVRDQFLCLGDDAEFFLRGLTEKHPRNAGFHVRQILQQKARYHCDDIHRAIVHACRYHAYDCQAVARILQSRATPRTLESFRHEEASKCLIAAMPTIEQHSLADYDKLLDLSQQE